jgi:hypothetical protein
MLNTHRPPARQRLPRIESVRQNWLCFANTAIDHLRGFSFGGLRSRTPGPPAFSSMNTTLAAAKEFRIFSPVCPRPPSGPSFASNRLIVGMDTSATEANCSWDQSNNARAALIWPMLTILRFWYQLRTNPSCSNASTPIQVESTRASLPFQNRGGCVIKFTFALSPSSHA